MIPLGIQIVLWMVVVGAGIAAIIVTIAAIHIRASKRRAAFNDAVENRVTNYRYKMDRAGFTEEQRQYFITTFRDGAHLNKAWTHAQVRIEALEATRQAKIARDALVEVNRIITEFKAENRKRETQVTYKGVVDATTMEQQLAVRLGYRRDPEAPKAREL